MKFTVKSKGQLGLILCMSLMLTACNQTEEYFPTQEFIVGPDAFCSGAKDLNSCIELGEACRPAFEDAADESSEPTFSVCVANPDYSADDSTDVADGSSSGDGADGSSSGGVDDDSSSGGSDGTSSGGSEGGSEVGSTAGGGTDGASSGGSNDGSTSGGTSGGGSVVTDVPPTIEEALAAKCENLDEKYLLIKKIVEKDKTSVVKKVKICHLSGNGSSHTIVIACPALKAHVKHDDYLGICK